MTNASAQDEKEQPIPLLLTSDNITPIYFSIPAPRGQILDADGNTLARTATVRRLMLQVPPLPEETEDAFCKWVESHWTEIAQAHPEARQPDRNVLADYFKNRRMIPMPITTALAMPKQDAVPNEYKHTHWRFEYQRFYPHGSLAAHNLGYVSPAGPVASGPLRNAEPLWREVEGKEGLEAAFNKDLTGQPGLLLMTFNNQTFEWQQKVIVEPKPGNNIVTTLRLNTQKSAEAALAESKRYGALVVVDASNGDVLAMASAPNFDPGMFAGGLTEVDFNNFTAQEGRPLNHRAISGVYPPGSVLKPFVALASLRAGAMTPMTRIFCGPKLNIDGRDFANWSATDEGYFDLRAAIIRSCNTYFYQTALATGAAPILESMHGFGFGERANDFPLTSFAKGNVPTKVVSRQALANLSIGQGEMLVNPLQVAIAMGTIINQAKRPTPRIVSQVQTQQQHIIATTGTRYAGKLTFSPEHIAYVRDGMYGVVNHQQGTATRARQNDMRVFAKTGTAQWVNHGKPADVVWLGGFIPDSNPPLAYAVALEGKPGDDVSGGKTAAPVMAKVLTDMFKSPAQHGITLDKKPVPFESDPLIDSAPPSPFFVDQPTAPVFDQWAGAEPVRTHQPSRVDMPVVVVNGASPAPASSRSIGEIVERAPPSGDANYYYTEQETDEGEVVMVPRAQPISEESQPAPAPPRLRTKEADQGKPMVVVVNNETAIPKAEAVTDENSASMPVPARAQSVEETSPRALPVETAVIPAQTASPEIILSTPPAVGDALPAVDEDQPAQDRERSNARSRGLRLFGGNR